MKYPTPNSDKFKNKFHSKLINRNEFGDAFEDKILNLANEKLPLTE